MSLCKPLAATSSFPLYFMLPAILLSSLLSILFCDAATPSLILSSSELSPISGWESGKEWNSGVISCGTTRLPRRSAAEVPTTPASTSSPMVLAAGRTRRKDPLDSFKYYPGGWNISDRHYWASVGFTAGPFFIMASVWFLIFAICLSIICCHHFCCRKEPLGYSRVAYALSLVMLIIFTISAITGCIVLYTGQGKFHGITTTTLEYLVGQADETAWTLRNVSDYLAAAKKIGVDGVSLPSEVQTEIDLIQTKINLSATTLSEKAVDNAEKIQNVLDSVRLTLVILAAVMLLLTFLGFLFSLFGMKVCVYSLVIFGWLLVTGTFILCGVFLLLHNATSDTCVAMVEWVENPTSHTAIDDLLPCVDNATAQETLMRSKQVTSQLVGLMNQVITKVTNINFSPNTRPLYYNQSGPLMPLLCNPFHPNDLTKRACASSEVNLTNATVVWKNYVCEASPSGICTTTGRLTPTYYNQMAAALNLSFGLYNYGPFLVSLQDCTFVRQTFTTVHENYCPGLQRNSKYVYIGLVMVSVAVMLSLVFWVIYRRERKHRVYTKHKLEE